jgi:hypothetical protein
MHAKSESSEQETKRNVPKRMIRTKKRTGRERHARKVGQLKTVSRQTFLKTEADNLHAVV